MIGPEPVVEQRLGGLRGALVLLACATRRRPYGWLERTGRSSPVPAAYPAARLGQPGPYAVPRPATFTDSVLVVSLPRMSITLTTTTYSPGSVYSMRSRESKVLRFAGPVGLPLVVEGVILVVPVHGPVVDPLRPVGDGLLDIGRHVVERDDEVLNRQS